jgi:DNA-binding transcriptional LysR family regulator
MNLGNLEVFLAVAAGNGVRGAAKLLSRSPATISNVVRDLEIELDATLFKRVGKIMVLTPAGETFLRYAKDITNSMRQAASAVKFEAPGTLLKLGASYEALGGSVLDAIADNQRSTGCEMLDLVVAENGKLLRMLISGDVDAAFVVKPPREHRGDATTWELCQKSLLCIAYWSQEIVLVQPQQRPGSGAELPRILAVLRADDVSCFLAERLTKAQGIRTVAVGSENAVCALLASGQACAALPSSIVERMVNPKAITHSPIGRLETMLVMRDGPWQPYLQARLNRDAVVEAYGRGSLAESE